MSDDDRNTFEAIVLALNRIGYGIEGLLASLDPKAVEAREAEVARLRQIRDNEEAEQMCRAREAALRQKAAEAAARAEAELTADRLEAATAFTASPRKAKWEAVVNAYTRSCKYKVRAALGIREDDFDGLGMHDRGFNETGDAIIPVVRMILQITPDRSRAYTKGQPTIDFDAAERRLAEFDPVEFDWAGLARIRPGVRRKLAERADAAKRQRAGPE